MLKVKVGQEPFGGRYFMKDANSNMFNKDKGFVERYEYIKEAACSSASLSYYFFNSKREAIMHLKKLYPKVKIVS